MARSSDSRKVLEWRRRMTRFQKTQRSVAQFCRDEGVSVPSFYCWRKRLTQQQQETEEASRFTPVRLVASTSVAVQFPGGTQLHIPMSNPRALRLVIHTLARVDADGAGGASC